MGGQPALGPSTVTKISYKEVGESKGLLYLGNCDNNVSLNTEFVLTYFVNLFSLKSSDFGIRKLIKLMVSLALYSLIDVISAHVNFPAGHFTSCGLV